MIETLSHWPQYSQYSLVDGSESLIRSIGSQSQGQGRPESGPSAEKIIESYRP